MDKDQRIALEAYTEATAISNMLTQMMGVLGAEVIKENTFRAAETLSNPLFEIGREVPPGVPILKIDEIDYLSDEDREKYFALVMEKAWAMGYNNKKINKKVEKTAKVFVAQFIDSLTPGQQSWVKSSAIMDSDRDVARYIYAAIMGNSNCKLHEAHHNARHSK